jgi:glycosyltransferase involved in cell wall biosynthesis
MTRSLAKICDVSVLVASGSDNIGEWRKLSCPMMEVATYHSNLSGILSFCNIPKFMSIKKFIDARNPDIVYYPGSHYWKPVLDVLIPSKTLIVMTRHDPVTHPGEKSFLAWIINFFDRRRPDAYIILNESQKEEFVKERGIQEDRVKVIPHGIFSSYAKSLSTLDNFPEFRILAGHEGRYFLFIGRIVKYKGILTLINAFISIFGKTDRALVIAGSGNFSDDEIAALGKIPPGRVFVFNRWLEDSEIATLTKYAYMTILPYEGATQSGVIPASAAFGTPSIASDSGGLKEQISDGETGFIFPAGNEKSLAEAMLNAHHMRQDEYMRMRERSLGYATENWSWDALAGELLSFMEAIAATR